jgi:hypothetical protein
MIEIGLILFRTDSPRCLFMLSEGPCLLVAIIGIPVEIMTCLVVYSKYISSILLRS